MMTLLDMDCHLYKVPSRKDWTVYESGHFREMDHGKYDDMVEEFKYEEILFLNMANHRIYLKRTKEEIVADREFEERIARECEEWEKANPELNFEKGEQVS